jgi:hypothetical protein
LSESRNEPFSGKLGDKEAGSLNSRGKVNFYQYLRSLHRLVVQSGPHLRKHPFPSKSIHPVIGNVKMAKKTLMSPPVSVNGERASLIGTIMIKARGL